MALGRGLRHRTDPSRSRVIGALLQCAVVLVAAGYAWRVSAREAGVAIAAALAAEMALAYICRPFESPVSARLNAAVALPVMAAGIAGAFAMPIEAAIVIIAGGALILRLATAVLYHWPGGVTEWSIPVVGLIVEAFTLFYMQKGVSRIG